MQQEWFDRESLASTKVGTPDPRQKDPPDGQKLLVAWDFPKSQFEEGLTVRAKIRFWDESEEVVEWEVERRRDGRALDFEKKKILTYQVEVVGKEGGILEVWEHQFWTKWIEV